MLRPKRYFTKKISRDILRPEELLFRSALGRFWALAASEAKANLSTEASLSSRTLPGRKGSRARLGRAP
jgi:hypothetical protein